MPETGADERGDWGLSWFSEDWEAAVIWQRRKFIPALWAVHGFQVVASLLFLVAGDL